MRQVSFSVRAPHFPPFAQRGPTYSISLQDLSQVHPFSDAEWRAALPRNPSRYRRRAQSAVSRCVLIRSNFTWPCQLPAAPAPARSLVRFPLPSPIAISNHSIAHLMKNTLNKREGEKDGDGEQKREGRAREGERSILTPPTEADDRFLFARLNKFPVTVR